MNKMNNDNLKRVLNKISGADRASVQQKTPPGYEQNDDMDFQITPTETPTEKERTEKFCDCLYGLMNNATATTEGWDAQLKSITTSCIHHLFRPGFDVIYNGIDTVATAGRVCSSFAPFVTYTECRIHCENLGYIRNTARFSKCALKCVELGPLPPFYVPNTGGFDPLSSYPRVLWHLQRRNL